MEYIFFCRRPIDISNDWERIACLITSKGDISIETFQEEINSNTTTIVDLIPIQVVNKSGMKLFYMINFYFD